MYRNKKCWNREKSRDVPVRFYRTDWTIYWLKWSRFENLKPNSGSYTSADSLPMTDTFSNHGFYINIPPKNHRGRDQGVLLYPLLLTQVVCRNDQSSLKLKEVKKIKSAIICYTSNILSFFFMWLGEISQNPVSKVFGLLGTPYGRKKN